MTNEPSWDIVVQRHGVGLGGEFKAIAIITYPCSIKSFDFQISV